MLPTAGGVVDIKAGNPKYAQPELSYTITQLTLGFEADNTDSDCSRKQIWQPALKKLPLLTSLQELHLSLFNPPAGFLAPALSSLTSLTKLFIRHPLPPEQQALPVSLKHLTVSRMFEPIHSDLPRYLQALQLTHLTALDTFVVYEEHWAGRFTEINNAHAMMWAGVPAGSALPANLQHVAVKAVPHVEPLLALTQLKTLTLTHGINDRWSGAGFGSTSPRDGLLALTQLPSLGRLIVKGQRPTQQQLEEGGLQAVLDALPVDLSGLDPAVSPSSIRAASSTPNRRQRAVFHTDLNGDIVRGPRGCSLWTGVKVLVDMLTGRNS
jgi:hypothetical protein